MFRFALWNLITIDTLCNLFNIKNMKTLLLTPKKWASITSTYFQPNDSQRHKGLES